MPAINKELDVYQGYNFKKDQQKPVGFITKLTIQEGEEIAADQTVKNPANIEEDLNVVAVLSNVTWSTGVTDPIYFEGQVSVHNKLKIQTFLFNTLSNMQVQFQFEIYEYDQIAKKYFLCFHSDGTDMKAVLQKSGEDLSLVVADDRSIAVQSPENYELSIGLVPEPEAQKMSYATADTKNFVKSWGLTVSAG